MAIKTNSESESSAESVLGLSLLYIGETAQFLSRVQVLILAALVGAALVTVTSTLEVLRVVVLSEPVELATALVSLFLIIPAAGYYTIRATKSMTRWKANLADFSFTLRFESQEPTGASPSLKLANQALQALDSHTRKEGSLPNAVEFTNYRLGKETFDVVIPGLLTRSLGGFRGALIMKRFAGESVNPDVISQVIERVMTAGIKVWRLMVVSDREFPLETLELLRSQIRELLHFAVDLVEETPTGFSVLSLVD